MVTVTKTIGTASRDYSTITLWEADLDDSGIYSASDDAVGEMYNDSAFDESPTINGGGTIGLSSRTLTVASADRHDGTEGTGARIVRTTTVTTGIYSNIINTTFEWFEYDANGNQHTSIIRVNRPYNVVRNCISHGGTVPANSTGMGIGITAESPFSANSHAYNNIVYDFGANTRCQPRGINWIRADSQVAYFYNNTVFNIYSNANDLEAQGFFNTNGSVNRTYKNNVACSVTNSGAGGAACFSIGSGTISYCASSDSTATGTGSLTSIVTADQFVSTTGGSEDLHLKAGADCIDAGADLGTTPTNVNIDIDGRDRDAEGDTWDIGADEYVVVAPSSNVKKYNGVAYANIKKINGVAIANIKKINGIA